MLDFYSFPFLQHFYLFTFLNITNNVSFYLFSQRNSRYRFKMTNMIKTYGIKKKVGAKKVRYLPNSLFQNDGKKRDANTFTRHCNHFNELSAPFKIVAEHNCRWFTHHCCSNTNNNSYFIAESGHNKTQNLSWNLSSWHFEHKSKICWLPIRSSAGQKNSSWKYFHYSERYEYNLDAQKKMSGPIKPNQTR